MWTSYSLNTGYIDRNITYFYMIKSSITVDPSRVPKPKSKRENRRLQIVRENGMFRISHMFPSPGRLTSLMSRERQFKRYSVLITKCIEGIDFITKDQKTIMKNTEMKYGILYKLLRKANDSGMLYFTSLILLFEPDNLA